jgi:hypothetical protein
MLKLKSTLRYGGPGRVVGSHARPPSQGNGFANASGCTTQFSILRVESSLVGGPRRNQIMTIEFIYVLDTQYVSTVCLNASWRAVVCRETICSPLPSRLTLGNTRLGLPKP